MTNWEKFTLEDFATFMAQVGTCDLCPVQEECDLEYTGEKVDCKSKIIKWGNSNI